MGGKEKKYTKMGENCEINQTRQTYVPFTYLLCFIYKHLTHLKGGGAFLAAYYLCVTKITFKMGMFYLIWQELTKDLYVEEYNLMQFVEK